MNYLVSWDELDSSSEIFRIERDVCEVQRLVIEHRNWPVSNPRSFESPWLQHLELNLRTKSSEKMEDEFKLRTPTFKNEKD